jgi:hypothetical protein
MDETAEFRDKQDKEKGKAKQLLVKVVGSIFRQFDLDSGGPLQCS